MSDKKNNKEIDLDFLESDNTKSDLEIMETDDEGDDIREYEDEEYEEESEVRQSIEDEITYYEDEEAYDDSDAVVKKKLTKEQIINRVMAGMGIVIAGFTIFYGFVAYGVIHHKEAVPEQEDESVEQVIQETTTEYVDTTLFVSPYSDENISEDIKKTLNNAELEPLKTGLYKLDSRVDNIMDKVTDNSKSTYDNVRNIYDYLLCNYEYKSKSYVDEDSIYDMCSSVDYVSIFDMEIIYRANKSLANNSGSPDDFACAFTVLMRRLGLEAYYIDGAIYNRDGEYESHGYSIIVVDDEYYIFDPSYDSMLLKNDKDSTENELESVAGISERQSGNTDETTESDTDGIVQSDVNEAVEGVGKTSIEYMAFGKKFSEVRDIFTKDDVEGSIEKFCEFDTLGPFSFKASFMTRDGDSADGSVYYKTGYSEDGNSVVAEGDITIYSDETIYIDGSVTGSNSNTWKLVAKIYDEDMNYITESTVYSEKTYSTMNEVSYSPSRAGNIRLVYMVTDSNGRTCTISKTIKVKSRYSNNNNDDGETTTARQTESQETTTVYETTTQETTTEEETTTQEITTTEKLTQETTTVQEITTDTTEAPSEDETTEPVEE